MAAGVAAASALAAFSALIVGAPACIPDLQLIAPDGSPVLPTCGNGVVDLDAGEQCDWGPDGAAGCMKDCTLDCDGGLVDPTTNHCYFVIPGAPTRFDVAQASCVLANAHLVTFVSADELGVVSSWNRAHASIGFWVGMRSEPNVGWLPTGVDEPGWNAGCPGCYAADVPGLPGNFPQLRDAGSSCLEVPLGTTPWNRIPCVDPRRIVCEREPPGALSQPCNGGVCLVVRKTLGAKRYVYFANKSAPDDAARLCAQFTAGSLVMLDSREEREQLWLELSKIDDSLKQVWIGLSRDADAGTDWRWDDGAPIDGGRPSPWGALPADGGAPRAYLERLFGILDSQLARDVDRAGEPTPAELAFVCQAAP
jgi:hypothetical protein